MEELFQNLNINDNDTDKKLENVGITKKTKENIKSIIDTKNNIDILNDKYNKEILIKRFNNFKNRLFGKIGTQWC